MTDDKRISSAFLTFGVGLTLNILLGAGKLVVGYLSSSVAVMSDAANNLSDAAVSVVTIIATALAARGADHEHPFGHGRYEYIAAFVLGAVILAVGAEAFIGGVRRAVYPADIAASPALWATLGAAIGVKLFMAVFYTVRGRKLGSEIIRAAAVDSASDAAVTAVVLASALTERFAGIHIDGYASIVVAAVVIVFALRVLKRTASKLVGERPAPELYDRIVGMIAENKDVISVHDLIINDYGERAKNAEADAVFPSDMSFPAVHAACDAIERRVKSETGIKLTLHADPDTHGDTRACGVMNRVIAAVGGYGASAHDISIDDGKKTVELDVRLPKSDMPAAEIKAQAEAAVRAELDGYAVTVNIDYA